MYLGEGIAKCATLTSLNLDLSCNRIDEDGAKYLGEGIGKCATLTSLLLVLSENSIGPNGKKILKVLIIKAKRLIKYYIRSD